MDQVGKTRVFLRPCVAERLEFARARTLALVARYPVCVCVCVSMYYIHVCSLCMCVCVSMYYIHVCSLYMCACVSMYYMHV